MLPQSSRVLLGPGDDAAVLAVPDGRVVATTDVLVEGRHFRREWCTAADLGYRAAAANLADVAAMGAVPTALLVGLVMPAATPPGWALDLAHGLSEACASSGASVVGGDLASGDSVVVAVTALGDLEGRAPVLRSGARAGDVVALAGRQGRSAAGLAALARGRDAEDLVAGVVGAYRRPDPPYAAGPAAARGGATAMCDVSDGLLADAGHLASASGVAIELSSVALAPDAELLAVGRLLGEDPLAWVLAGGEDHALVACFPAGAELPRGFRVVGRVDDGSGVTVDGDPWPGSAGWTHF